MPDSMRQVRSLAAGQSPKLRAHLETLKEFHTGRKRTLETKNRISKSLLGHKVSLETKAKLREKRMHQRLPLKATSIELAIWAELENRGLNFEKNKSVLGFTQPDAFIAPNICIYADGDYWHNLPSYVSRDKRQNELLTKNGYKVFRFWQHEIVANVSVCIDKIMEHVNG